MLPPNLLIVSMVIFLTTVSMAPVEEKEQEEVEATEEGELSEEEEDDDDSQSQDKIEGLLGRQQTTTAAASGGSGPGAQSAGGQTHEGAAGSSAAAGALSSSVASQPTGSPGSAEAEAEPFGVSAGQTQPAGNGQKLLNGGGGRGRADTQTDVLGLYGGEDTQLDYTGTVDPFSHSFLLGLMGGGNRFGPDVHINVPVITTGVTAAPYSDQSSHSGLDSSVGTNPAPTDPANQIDQSGPGHTSLNSGPDQSQSSSLPSSSHSAVNDGADAPDAYGNGRQTHLTDTNAGTDQPVSFTDLTGGTVSSLQVDLTASGVEMGHDVTESPIVLHTESVDAFTVSGVYSHTDLVTVATDLTGTETVSDPTGSPLDYSRPSMTDYTQTAVPVTEQFNTSGQGPEGAENVELEDTC